MKYLFLALAKIIFFSAIIFSLTSCSKSKKELLAKDWKATDLTFAGVTLTGDQVSLVYSFKNDGTFSRTEDGKTQDGKWDLTADDKKLELTLTDGNAKLEKAVKELTDDKLVLEGEENTMQRTETFAVVK